jgi:hypothetical protein
VWAAFADLVGSACETAGAERLGVDVLDFRVVRRLFRQIGDVSDVHGLSTIGYEENELLALAQARPVGTFSGAGAHSSSYDPDRRHGALG